MPTHNSNSAAIILVPDEPREICVILNTSSKNHVYTGSPNPLFGCFLKGACPELATVSQAPECWAYNHHNSSHNEVATQDMNVHTHICPSLGCFREWNC